MDSSNVWIQPTSQTTVAGEGGSYLPVASDSGAYTGDWPWYQPWYQPYPSTGYIYWPFYQIVAPVECSGDVHVFPCPHCDKCKCGAAIKTSKRKR